MIDSLLSLDTLRILKQVVEASSLRGAIKAEEMVLVGNAYNELCSFLKAVEDKRQDEVQENNEVKAESDSVM